MKGDRIIQEHPEILDDEHYPNLEDVCRNHYKRKREMQSNSSIEDDNVYHGSSQQKMKVEEFYFVFNLQDDIKSILLDLIYNDQIIGPSNYDEEEDMERSAKLAVMSMLYSSYADKNGEIEVSYIDEDKLYIDMQNAIFKDFNPNITIDVNYDDYDF